MSLRHAISAKLRPYPAAYRWVLRVYRTGTWLPRLMAGKLLSYDAAYRLALRGAHIGRPLGRPPAMPWNAVLQTETEWRQAATSAQTLDLPLHGDRQKNWDNLIALDAILKSASRAAYVLDAGAETYSRLLPSLFLYGYRHLYGINLTFTKTFRRGAITYSRGDITKTEFPPNTFHAIACLSVIEHGVDLEAYLREAHRILKPGGLLITSTDYWPDGVDTTGLVGFGAPVRVFASQDIRHMLALADSLGLRPTEPVPLEAHEPCVTWTDFDHRYTFIIITLRKA